MFEAIKNNDIKKIKELINNGADVNVKNIDGNTPLHDMIKYIENITIIKLLLSCY